MQHNIETVLADNIQLYAIIMHSKLGDTLYYLESIDYSTNSTKWNADIQASKLYRTQYKATGDYSIITHNDNLPVVFRANMSIIQISIRELLTVITKEILRNAT